MADVRPYPEIENANPDPTPVITDSVLGTDDPGGTPITVNFTLTRIKALFAAVAETLTNKRITKRPGVVASSATPTIDTDAYDLVTTELSDDISSVTLSGTPTAGQMLAWILTDGGSGQTIDISGSVSAGPSDLPTAITANAVLNLLLLYTGSAWKCMDAREDV
jgi:hypothetical protein